MELNRLENLFCYSGRLNQLFCGASMTHIMEVIYFCPFLFSKQVFSYFRRHLKARWTNTQKTAFKVLCARNIRNMVDKCDMWYQMPSGLVSLTPFSPHFRPLYYTRSILKWVVIIMTYNYAWRFCKYVCVCVSFLAHVISLKFHPYQVSNARGAKNRWNSSLFLLWIKRIRSISLFAIYWIEYS